MELDTSNYIENKIFTIRGTQVMIDYHLAELYGIETKRLNEQAKRNKKRFPNTFMFQLSQKEWDSLQSQIATTFTTNDLQSQIATAKKKNIAVCIYQAWRLYAFSIFSPIG